tara:strand:+ start:511 stop:1410 length:900 start_codon:yes stop_codon:yes gene_type:complete
MSAAITAVAVGVAAVAASQYLAKKPGVPGLASINPEDSSKDATKLNLAALPGAEKLGKEVNAYNQAELDKSFADIFPGYKDAAKKAGSNIEDLLSGKISDSTAAEVSRRAAARAVGTTGTFGPRGQALEARDFGLTSQQQQQTGLTALSGWLSSAKASLIAPKFDVTSMFLSPEQLFNQKQQERSAQFQRQNAANQVDAYYSGASRTGRALSSAGGALVGAGTGGLGSAAGAAAGAMGGGGGGGQSSPYNYGNVDNMMNGPSQSSGGGFYQPTSYGGQVNFGPSNYGNYTSTSPYWGGQ